MQGLGQLVVDKNVVVNACLQGTVFLLLLLELLLQLAELGIQIVDGALQLLDVKLVFLEAIQVHVPELPNFFILKNAQLLHSLIDGVKPVNLSFLPKDHLLLRSLGARRSIASLPYPLFDEVAPLANLLQLVPHL